MALLLSVFGPGLIRWLRTRRDRPVHPRGGPEGPPGEGGNAHDGRILINLAIVVPTLLFADLSNRYVWIALGATVLAMAIGVGDDWRKVSRKQNRGFSGRQKLVLQSVIGVAVGWASVKIFEGRLDATHVAFRSSRTCSRILGFVYVLFAAVVVVGPRTR